MTPLSPDALMEHADRLYSYAYSRLRDHHSAEDLVQETLLAGAPYILRLNAEIPADIRLDKC